MDFFEHQEQARRKTGRLVLLFVLAVVALVVGIYLIVRLTMIWMYGMDEGMLFHVADEGRTLWALFWHWDPAMFGIVVLGTCLVVVAGSTYKILQLRSGGGAVAEAMGATYVDQSTQSAELRQLLNVVEEMALASGTPTPPVYLLPHEPGINAFAAGYTADDAVIGVTRGCVELLSREELQGVIAHEFSHILNGDMRLNLNLLGLIHGIILIGLTGRVLLRTTMYGGRPTYRMGRSSGKSGLAIIVLGLGLMAIGAMGVFFGNMIKAAVSRQREFLADAAAVQFTRQPAGIAGALKKIGGLDEGSVMTDPGSEAYSHMFFSQGISGSFVHMFATHPPLIERIRRIEPGFRGRFARIERPDPLQEAQVQAASGLAQPVSAQALAAAASTPASVQPTVKSGYPAAAQGLRGATLRIGQPSPEHLDYARSLIESLPAPIRDAAHDPYGARALVYALLLNGDAASRKNQTERLTAHADPAVYRETCELEAAVDQLNPAARLPLLDMAIPTLGRLSPRQYGVFKRNVEELIQADRRVDLFEWMLQHLLLRHLEPKFRAVRKRLVQYYSLKRLNRQCSALLSALAYQPDRSDAVAQAKFESGAPFLQIPGVALLPREQCGLPVIDHALDVLAEASPREKKKILQACGTTILADKEVTVEEGELLRAIADALGCPMPPLLPGQRLIAAA